MTTDPESTPLLWRICIGAALSVPLLLGIAYYSGTDSFLVWLWSEQGPLEISHVLIPLLTMGLGLVTIGTRSRMSAIRKAGLGWLGAAVCGLALLCGLIAGEEASWGQHLWGWSTPETWSELNDQHETNLHNIDSWVDQKPRAVVELGVIVMGIVWPLLARYKTVSPTPSWRLILPPLIVLPIAFCAEGVRLLEWVPFLGGIHAWSAFPRPSELQELYFYTFFALCMLSWRQRLQARLAQPSKAMFATSLPETNSPHRWQAA